MQPLHPFAFFDVADGKEAYESGSSSAHNTAEAELAVALYVRLARVLADAEGGGVTVPALLARRGFGARVGFVTPYRGQVEELKRAVQRRLGDAALAELTAHRSIKTVDAWQGGERDVIIVSLVRTRPGALGFVDDVQRMNVALTRARRALWVLGSRVALGRSQHWGRLIAHAAAKERVVRQPLGASVPVPATLD